MTVPTKRLGLSFWLCVLVVRVTHRSHLSPQPCALSLMWFIRNLHSSALQFQRFGSPVWLQSCLSLLGLCSGPSLHEESLGQAVSTWCCPCSPRWRVVRLAVSASHSFCSCPSFAEFLSGLNPFPPAAWSLWALWCLWALGAILDLFLGLHDPSLKFPGWAA